MPVKFDVRHVFDWIEAGQDFEKLAAASKGRVHVNFFSLGRAVVMSYAQYALYCYSMAEMRNDAD